MKTYIDEALSFIESEEMCDYLRNHRLCAVVVSYAPAPIERKSNSLI